MSINIPSRPRRLDNDLFAVGNPLDAYTTRTLARNVNHSYAEGLILVSKVWPKTHPDFNLGEASDRGTRYVNHVSDRELVIGGFSCVKNPCVSTASLTIGTYVQNTKTIKIQCSSLGQEYDPSFPSDKALSLVGTGAYVVNSDYTFLLKKGSDRENIKIHIQGAEWQSIVATEYGAAGCDSGNISSMVFSPFDDYQITSSSSPVWKTGIANATISDGSCYALLQDANDNTIMGGFITNNTSNTFLLSNPNHEKVAYTLATKYKIFQPVVTLINSIFIKEVDITSFL